MFGQLELAAAQGHSAHRYFCWRNSLQTKELCQARGPEMGVLS
jgi:hypothetical protein